jgi:large subunit ribosomal protein L17
MRHLKRTAKLGRQFEHRNAMLANMVCSLIKHRRVTTTLAKAKAVRSVAEKMVTLGKSGTLHDRRLVAARLRQQPRSHFKGTPKRKGATERAAWRENEDVVHILFDKIAPNFKERHGGYTRIIRLNQRQGDAAQRAILEWVDLPVETAPEPVKEEKQAEAAKT